MPGARDRIVFFLNGQRCEAAGDDAVLTVSDYLRHRCGMVGTKIVCSEGDCGSCTVLVGRPEENAFRYETFDSCIQFVFQLDGKHLVTVEGLANGSLTAVQQAMVDCHGSQCGFCTPGFVMAMTGLVDESKETIDETTWRTGLTGNLCRCTGYQQIIEAGQRACKNPSESLNVRFPPEAMLEACRELQATPIEIKGDGDGLRLLYSPTDIGDALRFRGEHPGCCVVAGATDLGVQRNKGRIAPEVFLDLNRVELLDKYVVLNNDRQGPALAANALCTWTSLLEWSKEQLPEFARILQVFGSPQIRNAGTIGGNLINASPIADSLPLLYVLGAQLVVGSAEGNRAIDIDQFYHGYKQFDLQPNELLTEVLLPLPSEGDLLRLYKVSRRRDLDISTFTAAILMRLDGDTIREARLVYGAVGPTVLRLHETEAMLRGEPFAEETMRRAGDVAVKEITPITDVRGAADYRYQLARNVLLKFHAEHMQEAGCHA